MPAQDPSAAGSDGGRRVRRHQVRPAEPAGPAPVGPRAGDLGRHQERPAAGRSPRPCRSTPPRRSPTTPFGADRVHDDTTNGWQIAAWAEAAVLAALALGSVVLISGRTRSRRLMQARGAPPWDGAGVAPSPRQFVPEPPHCSLHKIPRRSQPCSPAASPPAPARCASSSPPPPPPCQDAEFGGHVHHTAAVAVVATGDTKNDLHVQTYDAGHRRRHQGPTCPARSCPRRRPRKPVSAAPAGRATARRRGRRLDRRLADRRPRRGRPDRRGRPRRRRRDDVAHAPRARSRACREPPRGAGPSAAPPLTASASGTGAGPARGSSAARRPRRACRCAATRAGPARSRGAGRG